eukprot:IDg20528t1
MASSTEMRRRAIAALAGLATLVAFKMRCGRASQSLKCAVQHSTGTRAAFRCVGRRARDLHKCQQTGIN